MDANLTIVSIAGRFAYPVVKRALDNNLHVLLFSDNVPLEEEIELKQIASQKKLLLMGPDCGTAIINGVPLAFANKVTQGSIGIIGASGTGMQEVTTLISNLGGGISQAIGTGGRDLKAEVGGLTFLLAMDFLEEDSETKVIVLISKPPHPTIKKKILEKANTSKKSIVVLFLGEEEKKEKKIVSSKNTKNILFCKTLEEAAYVSVSKSKSSYQQLSSKKLSKLLTYAQSESKKLNSKQKYLRALYSGGTYALEAQIVLKEKDQVNKIYSNIPVSGVSKLTDANKSSFNTIIDFGDDQFTVGRPHPMIDFSYRNKRLLSESADQQVAVIVYDLVLGYGSHQNPLTEIVPVIKEINKRFIEDSIYIPIIFSVTGTDADPQVRSKVVKSLTELEIIVCASSSEAITLAKMILSLQNKLKKVTKRVRR